MIILFPLGENYALLPSLLSPQQMPKCAVGCHMWMKRQNREKTTRYSGFGEKTAGIRAKMGCVLRTGKWLLIDIRQMRGWFLGVWKGFFTE